MKYGILFDLDGTLLNTLEDLTDSVNYALAHYGCDLRTKKEIRSFLGNGAVRLIEQSLPGRDTDPDVQAVLDVYKAYYRTHSNVKTAPFTGIPEALETLKKKYPLGIVTNKHNSSVQPLCAEFFEGIYALGEEPDCPRKPAADMVIKAMDAIGVQRCVYVGDSDVDILTAQNAGMPCLAVSWGYRDKYALRLAGAKHICDDPRDIPKMIEEIIHGK